MGLLNQARGELILVSVLLAAICFIVGEVAGETKYYGSNGHQCMNNNCYKHYESNYWRCLAGKNWLGRWSFQYCSPRHGYDHLDRKCNGPCAPREESYYWCWNDYNWAGWNYCGKVEELNNYNGEDYEDGQ